MILQPIEFTLKDMRRAVLKSATTEDASEMLSYITQVSGETPFLLTTREEFEQVSLVKEKSIIQETNESPDKFFITCFVDGKVVGNGHIFFNSKSKLKHRATCGIAILKDFWNLGIGTKIFETIIELSKQRSVSQIELNFVEGNTRARALYEKMGFKIVGVVPKAIRLTDGTFLDEYMMVKWL